MDPTKVRVLIAGDHPVLRQGFRELLSSSLPGFELLGEASDGWQTLERARALEPDVLLLDVRMPGPGMLETTRALRRDAPGARIVLLGHDLDEPGGLEALHEGAQAFIALSQSDRELVKAIQLVMVGKRYVRHGGEKRPASSRRATGSASGRVDPPRRPAVPSRPLENPMLNERELEVLQLLLSGFTPAQVAARLGIAIRTVDRLRAHIASKIRPERPKPSARPEAERLGPLVPRIQMTLRRFSRLTGIAVGLHHEDLHQPLSLEQMQIVVRVVWEGLTNVAEHAGVKRARLDLRAVRGWLQVRVEDDGVGFSPERVLLEPRDSGLRRMRQGLEDLGGKLIVESSPGHGSQVTGMLPLEHASSGDSPG